MSKVFKWKKQSFCKGGSIDSTLEEGEGNSSFGITEAEHDGRRKKNALDFFLPGEENRYQELTLYMLFRIPSATSGSRKEERIKNCTGGK